MRRPAAELGALLALALLSSTIAYAAGDGEVPAKTAPQAGRQFLRRSDVAPRSF